MVEHRSYPTLIELKGSFSIDLCGLRIEPIVLGVLYSTKYLRELSFLGKFLTA